MAYRKIHDQFWTDPDIEELTPEQKYFYLYLLTNPGVNQIGLYELSVKRTCYETGYNTDTVYKLLEYFEKKGKIKRSKKTHEILIVKFYFHNFSKSPKVESHVNKLLSDVKDKSLIQYIYSMHTQSQEEEEEVQEEAKEKPKKKFSPPTQKDIESYMKEIGLDNYNANEQSLLFSDFYISKGWLVGKSKMKDWQAAARRWIKNMDQYKTKNGKTTIEDLTDNRNWGN